jgi:peptidoglycan hydrolase-like protein with peptidoglycan-binding domain
MEKNNIAKPTANPTPLATTSEPAVKDDGGDLDPGDSGPRVTKLQEELAERGFYKGAFDGQFGAKTQEAVIAYKKSKGFGEGPKAGKRVLDDLGIGA